MSLRTPPYRSTALALIIPSVVTVAVMALHPTGIDAVRTASAGGSNAFVGAIHLVAIIAQVALLAGALGLTLIMRERRDVAVGGFVFYAMASVAAICAAVASGFVAPGVLRGLGHADPAVRAAMMSMLGYTGLINQGFAKVDAACSSIAILLWSVAGRDSNPLSRGAVVYGLVIGILTTLAVLANHIQLDVHGFGAVVLAQAIWMVWAASQLLRREDAGM